LADQMRIGIVDDHPMLREGIRGTLHESAEFLVVGMGESLHDAIAIAQNHSPDVLLLDINIPGNGLDVARLLSRSYPKIRIVIFTVSERVDHLQVALAHGAIGYLLKGATADELYRCLRSVKAGRRYIAPELAGKVLGGAEDMPISAPGLRGMDQFSFTHREVDVAELLGSGKTNREIADVLEISEKTVKHHMSVIMEKLNVRNRVEAALMLSRLTEKMH
jgi:two-component system, NarL family, nitrate/nitrite response regulator NarL